MTEQARIKAASSDANSARRGLFLPSMVWATDRKQVEAETYRLLAVRKHLNAFVAGVEGPDECASWYMMAEASLARLDRDIDDLFDWLEEPGHPD